MAVNPMQKKARNSFILGVLITFIIMALSNTFNNRSSYSLINDEGGKFK